MCTNPVSDTCISHGNGTGRLISCSAQHPKAFWQQRKTVFNFSSNFMFSGNDSCSETRWWGALISLLCNQLKEVLLGMLGVIATAWGGTSLEVMTSCLNYGCRGDLREGVCVPLPLDAGESMGHWVIGCREMAPCLVWVVQLHWLQAFYFVMVGKCLNLRLELHTPPCPLLITARKKRLFFLEKMDGYPCYLYHSHSLHLATRQWQHPGSRLMERTTPVWYGPMSQGNGNSTAQPPHLLSRNIWICISVSHQLGTF